jgi:hypothetical protein
MACSKLLDLPELINEVIQYFRYDYKTLHSCILVNRLWCRLTVPLLWEDPFSIKFPKNYRFIEIYLNNLNEDYKAKLNEYVIHNLFPSNYTLFNYPSFIQHFDTDKVRNSIEKWIKTATKEQYSNYLILNTNLSYSQTANFAKFIYKSLFLIFIENEVNLHSFEVTVLNDTEIVYFDEIFELILQNPNFICNIKNFKLDLDEETDNLAKFLEIINSNCCSISSLYFLFPFPLHNSDYLINEKSLSQIINSQENLKKILYGYNDFPLHHSLLSLKYPNCSNTLNTIIFYHIDFKNIIILSEVFNQLNVLESIHIVFCYSLNSKFVQQINNITKPFKLKSLFLDEILQIESLEPLIQKSANHLENFGSVNRSQLLARLLDLVREYCSKIKFLYLAGGINDQNINLITSLIESIKRNLNYLYIKTPNIEFISIILRNLGQILPYRLEYLSLHLNMNNISDLEVFLKNSQNTFIKKLLISNIKKEENEGIFPYIKEYIMEKKRVKYLAILESFHGKCEDLFFLKDKVKEFELHDIQVKNYDDLSINIYDFIKND